MGDMTEETTPVAPFVPIPFGHPNTTHAWNAWLAAERAWLEENPTP